MLYFKKKKKNRTRTFKLFKTKTTYKNKRVTFSFTWNIFSRVVSFLVEINWIISWIQLKEILWNTWEKTNTIFWFLCIKKQSNLIYIIFRKSIATKIDPKLVIQVVLSDRMWNLSMWNQQWQKPPFSWTGAPFTLKVELCTFWFISGFAKQHQEHFS